MPQCVTAVGFTSVCTFSAEFLCVDSTVTDNSASQIRCSGMRMSVSLQVTCTISVDASLTDLVLLLLRGLLYYLSLSLSHHKVTAALN